MTLKNKTKQGIAPLLLVLIIAVITGGVGAIYLKATNSPVSIESAKENIFGIQKEETLESIEINTDGLDFSLTSIQNLEVPALNIEVPNINTPKLGNMSAILSVDIQVQKDSINIESPNLENIKPKVSMPSIPKNVNIPIPEKNTLNNINSNITPSDSAPQIDCMMFQTVPNCSYVGTPGTQGYEACKQCFPSK